MGMSSLLCNVGSSSTAAADADTAGVARQTTRASNATVRDRRPTRVTVAVASSTAGAPWPVGRSRSSARQPKPLSKNPA